MSDALVFLYQDDALVVVDKPAGLATHRGWAPETDVVVARARAILGRPVFAVHRLDRGTSGTLALALTAESARSFGALFASGHMKKSYLALVRGIPEEEGLINHPVPSGEDPHGPKVEARTAFTRLEIIGRYSLVQARPLTGRLHQIRRHLKHLSCPILGDTTYGKGDHNRLFRSQFGLHRLFLHAERLQCPHPLSAQPLDIHAPLPPELLATLAALRAAQA